MTRTHKTEVFEYTPEEEAEIDRKVDTGVFTYDDARREMGIKATQLGFDVTSPDFSVPGDHKPANTKAAMRPQYGDNGSIETPDGVPHYYRPFEPLSEEQVVINERGRQKVDEALQAAKEAKIDHLMDTMGVSYDEAAKRVG